MAAECFCQDEDGSKQIFCEHDGQFIASASCKSNEWCVGPRNRDEAIYGPTSDLCREVDISCGGSTLYPSCNLCPRNDGKEWCTGDCYLDDEEDICKEIYQYAKVVHARCHKKFSATNWIFNILQTKKTWLQSKDGCSKSKDCLGVYQQSCDPKSTAFYLCSKYIEVDAKYDGCVYKKDSVRGYPSDFIEEEKQCVKSNVNVLREFTPASQSISEMEVTRKDCEEYCAKHEQCWGCSGSETKSLQVNAIPECGSHKPWRGIMGGGISQKPVCFDVKTYLSQWKERIEWGIDPWCSSSITYNKSNYIERCCLAHGNYTLACKNKEKPDGWYGGYLEIQGRVYCDDFVGYKGLRELTISEKNAVTIVQNTSRHEARAITNQDRIPRPPIINCVEGTVEYEISNCTKCPPRTCICEDHCDWDACHLYVPPQQCLDKTMATWKWNSYHHHWTAQTKQGEEAQDTNEVLNDTKTKPGMDSKNPEPSHKPNRNRSCLLYTSPSPRDLSTSRMPSSA